MIGVALPDRSTTIAKDPQHADSRIAIIGAGHVGATAAYALMLRALFREIVLIDSNVALAGAEAADLRDANALARPATIWAGTYADAKDASIAVITAGGATHGSESRLSVAARSCEILTSCVDQLLAAEFAGIILVAANPVDLMALAAFRRSGFPSARVIGTGTLLDTSRLRKEIADRCGVAPAAVEGLVLGEHGDSEFVAFSSLRIGGMGLDRFVAPAQTPNHDDIARKVREAAYEIVSGKGYTSFGVATAIVRICEAIVRDERAVLPVSTWLTGQFDIADLYLSMPCVLGAGGIERVLKPELSDGELAALQQSAATLRQAGLGLPISGS
jgi:L-lactate dehydrogenase